MSSNIYTKTYYKYRHFAFSNHRSYSDSNLITKIIDDNTEYIVQFNVSKFNDNNICFIPDEVYRINNKIYAFPEKIVTLDNIQLDHFGRSIIDNFGIDLHKYIDDTNFNLKLAGIYDDNNVVIYNSEIINMIYNLNDKTAQILYIMNLIQNFSLNFRFPLIITTLNINSFDRLNKMIIDTNFNVDDIFDFDEDDLLSNYVVNKQIKFAIFENPIISSSLNEKQLYNQIFKFLKFINSCVNFPYIVNKYLTKKHENNL